MKKLIALLNEYQESRSSKFRFLCYDHNSSSFIIEKNPRMILGEETIISKKFWFIQWLVQDKLEFDRVRDKSDFPLLYAGWWGFYSDTDIIIATLAMEDDPISFLISILK